MRSYLGLGLVLGLGVAILGSMVFIITRSTQEAQDREYRIVIPAGTGEQIAAGENPQIVPDQIQLEVGDTLVIENQDEVGHEISDLWVGAGETLRQTFSTAGVYSGACTVHKDSQIQIIVNEAS